MARSPVSQENEEDDEKDGMQGTRQFPRSKAAHENEHEKDQGWHPPQNSPLHPTARELEAAVSIRRPPWRPRRNENEEEDGRWRALQYPRSKAAYEDKNQKDRRRRHPRHVALYPSCERTGTSRIIQPSPAVAHEVSILAQKRQSLSSS